MELTLSGDARDFTRHIVDSCSLDSASIFLCDRTGTAPRISYLFHHNISRELQDRYERHAIFHEDPFTDPSIQERKDIADDDGVLLANDRRLQAGPPPARYWHFMVEHDVQVVGASTRRLLPGLYATVGLHRRRAAGAKGDIVLPQLDMLTRRLQDMIGGQMLRQLLSSANGLSSFRSSYFDRCDGASSPVAKRLSPREMEIATLVCQGRQNKEIAYLTDLTEHTIENHLRRIYAKLSIHNRSALVAAMVAAGNGPH
ncbi:helix-turn-helix transcriptional regulator [Sphingomonas adhaesiva]|uniref:helix-turn-helix transcriptional regulator n=1 Tax=Sphingomonas adhaesiva TaxID=28212 RepID=UPI002FFBC9A7